ncbi:DUF1007 family protein [Paracoccus versutus]|uniref:DUF1007 family protein n=1 Tax=Paracoccus TaxID=265 RepID=UPI00051D661D|nr:MULTISPECIES: DUF1007 family protein [Paracoccus]KGJ08844.1 hypothetical protein IT40_17480 [Paracoccus versutus]MDF3905930.1 DUF1007 family protein [Paracoccus sp. AS002]WEJ79713.1 DUF1007 family protein [Paracoccus versutus]WGR56812.1 DUF1007 family protein [Paracoccus versutus]
MDDGEVQTAGGPRAEGASTCAQGAISIRMYDPGYYTTYRLSSPLRIAGRQGCEIRVRRADGEAARRRHADELALLDALVAMGQKITSNVGAAFADEWMLSCRAAR